MAHCGQCPDYPCATMKHLPQARGSVEQGAGRALSEQEYRLFVQPYESTRTSPRSVRGKALRGIHDLSALRATVEEEVIRGMGGLARGGQA